MQHFDSNGWPVIGKYIGLLDDNDNKPIYYDNNSLIWWGVYEKYNQLFMSLCISKI